MYVFLIGVNHRTAPVEVREKLNLAMIAMSDFNRSLSAALGPELVSEIAVLSTCNRSEVYLDQLEASLDEGRARREAAVPIVEEIVCEETDAIVDWLRSRRVAPLIHRFRKWATSMADAEARRTIGRLGGLSASEEELVYRMARRIVNKILHEPTMCFKAKTRDDGSKEYVKAFAQVFGLGADGRTTRGDSNT